MQKYMECVLARIANIKYIIYIYSNMYRLPVIYKTIVSTNVFILFNISGLNVNVQSWNVYAYIILGSMG